MRGICLKSDYDLLIKVERDEYGRISSGLVLDDVLAQNQALIIGCNKGEWKERPYVGVGISGMMLDHDPLAWRSEIREQLELDGQTVNKVEVTNTGIKVDAHY